MGWYVHIHVCFSCNENEPVAALAKKHREIIKTDVREVEWFLDDLGRRTGGNPGPKGGLSLWGMTGNYTRVDEFVEVLRPFWLDMLSTSTGPLNFEHILVFEEQEQSEKTIAHEISYDEDSGQLTIKRHECPFAFMQM